MALASLTINENADPDVRRDMEVALNKLGEYRSMSRNYRLPDVDSVSYLDLYSVPAQWAKDGTFHHTMEGEDDMPAHVKSSLMGPSLNIPVSSAM